MKILNSHSCCNCGFGLYDHVHEYSMKYYGFSLCKNCQKWLTSSEEKTTIHSKKFYLALKIRKANPILEQFDGHKHIDIAITGENLPLNIEIDGSQHYTSVEQSYADLLRTFHSFIKGYHTLRLPNVLIAEKLDETADIVVDMLDYLRKKNEKKIEIKKRKS